MMTAWDIFKICDRLAELGVSAEVLEPIRVHAQEVGMTCTRCGQYGDGCMCTTVDLPATADGAF